MIKKITFIAAIALFTVACNATKDGSTKEKKEEVKPQPKPTTVDAERDSRGNYVK